MQFLALSAFYFSHSVVFADGQNSLNVYSVKENEEAVYNFSSVLRTSMLIVQMASSYNYAVIVTKEESNNRLLVRIENITYSDKIENPSEADIQALQIPFIVDIDEEGDWEKITVSPKDTKFSMDQKDTLLTLMTFNHTRISDALAEVDSNEDNSLEETPLGNCTMAAKVNQRGQEIEIEYGVHRRECTGKTEFDMGGFSASPESYLAMKMGFENNPIRFIKAEVFLTIIIETSPKMRIKAGYTYQFAEFRPKLSNVDLKDTTMVYSVKDFEKKLAELQTENNEEE